MLDIPQNVTERLLTEQAVGLGTEIRRGCELVGLSRDEDGVTAELADGGQLRSRYLVGGDGGRSAVRKLLGVAFPGEPSRADRLLGEMEVTAPPETWPPRRPTSPRLTWRSAPHPTRRGCIASSYAPRRWPRAARCRRLLRSSDRGCARLRAPTSACTPRAGSPASVTPAGWPSSTGPAGCCWPAPRYTSTRRWAEGLNLGIQEAVNLGWKLAAEVDGWAHDLLDTYN